MQDVAAPATKKQCAKDRAKTRESAKDGEKQNREETPTQFISKEQVQKCRNGLIPLEREHAYTPKQPFDELTFHQCPTEATTLFGVHSIVNNSL